MSSRNSSAATMSTERYAKRFGVVRAGSVVVGASPSSDTSDMITALIRPLCPTGSWCGSGRIKSAEGRLHCGLLLLHV